MSGATRGLPGRPRTGTTTEESPAARAAIRPRTRSIGGVPAESSYRRGPAIRAKSNVPPFIPTVTLVSRASPVAWNAAV